MKTILCSLALISTASAADPAPLSAEEFDAYTLGKTFYFSQGGQEYGGERYLPQRRVQWSFLDGECKSGHWYPEGNAICFVYEDNPEPQCWLFSTSEFGLIALVNDSNDPTEPYEARHSNTPMVCLGPKVGV